MLCVEDALDGLRWAESIGGLPALIARSEANLAAVAAWVARIDWADFLAEDPAHPLLHFDLPEDHRALVHRARCERPGRGGEADRRAAGKRRRGLRHRRPSRRAAGIAHLGRRDGRDRRRGGAAALARLGLCATSPPSTHPRRRSEPDGEGSDFGQALPGRRRDLPQPAASRSIVKPGLSPAELRAIIGDYDGLAIRSATKVTQELLDAATSLKVVGRAGIGVDNVDVPRPPRAAWW